MSHNLAPFRDGSVHPFVRHTRDDKSDGQRRRNVPELGRRARARREEEDWFEGCHCVLGPHRYQLVRQTIQVDSYQEQKAMYV